ncbi:hypothetical protein C8R45DRAFT_1071625 [Mycena sanguinolenta]|nr:hypothetical protein C8R45DRAFT_1071625 [Mycena sanguinolenta]
MDTNRNSKRPRVDEENSSRDPNFYFEDGNIVLSARDTDDCIVYFRVHRSILTKHSPVFKDMFTMPLPQNEDQYDGAPLVEMAGDSANALQSLIALLYDPEFLSDTLKSWDFAARMYDPVVLAKKYQIDWIPEMAAVHLKKLWPQTLTGWDRVADIERRDASIIAYCPEDYEGDEQTCIGQLREPVTAIRLARECNTSAILPAAFLHLLRQPYEDSNEGDDARVSWDAPARKLLTTEDLVQLALARERMGKWFSSSSRRDPPWNSSWCESEKPTECHLTVVRAWLDIAVDFARDGNILAAPRRSPGSHICSTCSSVLTGGIHDLRQKFFDDLASFFQL